MKLKLGFSPCPNDTFMFYALVHNKINTPLSYTFEIEDISLLNNYAQKSFLHISKISYNSLGKCLENYQSLLSGAALGQNCGPLLIAKSSTLLEDITSGFVAIPGKNTTANLLFSMAFPKFTNSYEVMFSSIEKEVIENNAIAGVIIHETRFTYEEKGLKLLFDFGNFWHVKTKLPLPLGGIAIKKDLDKTIKNQVNQDIRNSVLFAINNPEECLAYCAEYAQEMDPNVMQKHIALYVNNYSVNLGKTGKKAILRMFKEMKTLSLISDIPSDVFIA